MSDAATLTFETEQRRHFWRNYLAHTVEGGLFLGAANFVSATTLLPTMIKGLGGGDWLVSLMPVATMVGFMLPPIFTAHLIDRLTRYKPLLLVTGVVQRVPYLLAAVVLFRATAWPGLALWTVALTPLVAGVGGGVSVTAWQQLVVRTVPASRRSGLFAVRFIVSCALGLLAAWVVRVSLKHHPGATGYGLLHLYTFFAIAASYAVFCTVRETGVQRPHPSHTHTLAENLRALPHLVRRQKSLDLYLLTCAFSNGLFIWVPFLAIHARQTLGRTEDYLGDLLIAQMLGAIGGNLLAGWLGDRFGGKRVMLVSRLLCLLAVAGSLAAGTDLGFRIVFFGFGFAFFALQVGNSTMNLEICPPRQRSTYLAIIALVNLPSLLLATQLSNWLWRDGRGHFGYTVGLSVACLLVSLGFLLPIPDPRHGRDREGAERESEPRRREEREGREEEVRISD